MDSLNPYYNADNWETVYKPTGSGTADDPYLLSTAWNLAWLKAISVTHPEYNSTSVYYKLTTNIYVEDDVNWKQIGFSSVAFKGHFDGDGNEITNLNISNSSHNSFFAMTDSATIKNLTVKGKLVNTLTSGGSYFAGIVGAAQNTTITNCNNYVNITNTYGGYSGGIVGQASGNTIIENCNNYGIIDCREFCGGLVGGYTSVLTGATISNCNNYGKVNGNYREIGGIVGITNDTILSITYCNNYASVLCPDTAKVIGGIVGSGYASQITYCKNEGEITGNTNLVGTILGLNNNSSTLSDTNTNTGTANGGSDLIGTGY